MAKFVSGIYLIAVAIGMLLWLSGPLYGVMPAAVWMAALVIQGAIGGAIIIRAFQ